MGYKQNPPINQPMGIWDIYGLIINNTKPGRSYPFFRRLAMTVRWLTWDFGGSLGKSSPVLWGILMIAIKKKKNVDWESSGNTWRESNFGKRTVNGGILQTKNTISESVCDIYDRGREKQKNNTKKCSMRKIYQYIPGSYKSI